ncbi:MAG: hypothetical protein J6Z29_05185 [Ruminococcus sp.]|nr:hypothetical protein [Ruminococcus sp.]
MELFCLSRPNLPRYHHIADNYRNRGASSVPNFCICCCLSFVYGVFLLIRRCGYLKKQQVLFYLYFFSAISSKTLVVVSLLNIISQKSMRVKQPLRAVAQQKLAILADAALNRKVSLRGKTN